jgi:hypothetical protein
MRPATRAPAPAARPIATSPMPSVCRRSDAGTEPVSIVLPPTTPAFHPSRRSASIPVIGLPCDMSRRAPLSPAPTRRTAPLAGVWGPPPRPTRLAFPARSRLLFSPFRLVGAAVIPGSHVRRYRQLDVSPQDRKEGSGSLTEATRSFVVRAGNEEWSTFGAQRLQPVAIGGKGDCPQEAPRRARSGRWPSSSTTARPYHPLGMRPFDEGHLQLS